MVDSSTSIENQDKVGANTSSMFSSLLAEIIVATTTQMSVIANFINHDVVQGIASSPT